MSADHILGLGTGVVFGFLLQRARVLRFEKQVGALLFKDMTIIKFMLSSILVAMVGILLLSDFGLINLNHKSMKIGAILVGGALFGVGWGIMGYCPGTAIGALGEGRWHALSAVFGMLVGAGIYAEIYPALKDTLLVSADLGKISLPQFLGISPWIVVTMLGAASLGLFYWFEKKHL